MADNLAFWDFEEGIDGWYYGGADWEYNYNGEPASISWDEDERKLKLDVDYSKDADKDWSQVAVCYWNDEGLNLGTDRLFCQPCCRRAHSGRDSIHCTYHWCR